MKIFFNGTVLRSQPDHANLEGCLFLKATYTAPVYALYSIQDKHPGMFWVGREKGVKVFGELYEVPEKIWKERISKTEPPGLYLGPVLLEDGTQVYGMLYPEEEARKHIDISSFGSWVNYLNSKKSP
jgi:gamma-glutamylaminecyclotransferase